MYLGIGLGITRLSGVLGFNPASLFANGEEGAWYDPSDLSTLYKDYTGTEAVTAAGQQVGLMLDKSKGLILGSELVTNGTFDNDLSGWTPINSTIVWESGAAKLTSTFANQIRAAQSFTTVVGKTYKATATVWQGTTTVGMSLLIPGVTSSATVFSTTPTEVSVIFKATSTSTAVRPGTSTATPIGETCFVDNVSVREIPGNHATQSTGTARPTLAVTGTTPATLGSELVTNGTFDTAASWSIVGANVSISGGQATWTGAAANERITQGSLDPTKTYSVSLDVVSHTSGSVYFLGGLTSGGNALGTWSYLITGVSQIYIRAGGGGFTGSIDNITVKEVLTWADPKYYLDFDGVDDKLSAAFASAQAQPNTIATAFKFDDYTTRTFDFVFDSIDANRHRLIDNSGTLTYLSDSAVSIVASTTNETVALMHFDSPSSSARIDGAIVSSGDTTGTKTWSGVVLAQYYASNIYGFNGRIYGFIGVNRTLTADEIDGVESYLASKSGVTL